jgi:RNA polymerase sigma-70 factor (ECF subfamily)
VAAQPDDEGLMMGYRNGNLAAFDLLYRRHKDPLYRTLLRSCGNEAIAAELFQETWAAVIRSRASYEVRAKFSTWLYRIAHSKMIDYVRAMKFKTESIDPEAPLAAPEEAQPERQAENASLGSRLRAGLALLPQEQREAFLLKEEGGLSLEQIAEATGVGRETVKSRLRYALAKLRQELADVA